MLASSTIALLCTLLPATLAYPSLQARDDHPFTAPGPNDRTSPCPMMNTLANHGFIPRVNISLDQLIVALQTSVGLEESATRLVATIALTASTTGNPNTFNLDDLRKHNVIEHDGSLSRADIFSGDNFSFNKTIWAQTASFFTNSTISLAQAVAARKARIASAQAANPQFSMSATNVQGSLVETALYTRLFGDATGNGARTDWVKSLFEQERLPYELGYPKVPKAVMTTQELLTLAGTIAAM